MSTKMANSPSAMPGAFNFHTTNRDTAPPRLSGSKSHIFQPPRTPSASASSSLILTRSTASVMSISSAGDRSSKLGPRKRTLEDYHEGTGVETPRNGYAMDSEDWSAFGDMDGRTPGSPKPFVNTRYQLAGGMDTPGLASQHAIDMQNQYGDLGYRKSLADTHRPSKRDLWGEQGDLGDYFGRDCNGRGRYNQGESPRGDGWSKTTIQVAGAVVGKVWEFCKSSAAVFRGFQAGGGTRYQINPSRTFGPVEQSMWEEKDEFRGERESTPLPGQYPIEELEYIPDYMDRPTPEHTPPRPSKRRQISANQESLVNAQEELAKNWVVVPPTSTPSKPAQPRLSRFSQPTASSTSRRSVAGTSNRPASRAGFGTPVSARRPGLSTQSSRISHAGSPALNPGRGASYASPRSPANSASRIPCATGSPLRNMNAPPQESPAAKEAKRWATLKKKEEREADESIRRLDAQLKAMIREGKEALGTKIEVDIEDDLDLNTTRSRPGNSRKWAF
ncbi:hypothetical protein BKA65DRAFT_516651 [Rhexocercosporidium sp. MPI-PUGE-AT-0058]|nr:hypothetical protein BKA65DRAFT_516651 [Rhexocercosporidium sp. MPI-PUGE-AT-0058]